MAQIQYLSELFLEVLSMQGPVKPLKQNLLPKLLLKLTSNQHFPALQSYGSYLEFICVFLNSP